MYKKNLARLGAVVIAAMLAASPAAAVAAETDTGMTAAAAVEAPDEEGPAPAEEPEPEPEPQAPAEEPEPEPQAPAEEPENEPAPAQEESGSGASDENAGAQEQLPEEGQDAQDGEETPADAGDGKTAQEEAAPEQEPAKGKDAGTAPEKGTKEEKADKSVSINGKEYKTKTPDKGEAPEGEKEADAHTGSNDELIARQHIVNLPTLRDDFRFYHTDDAVCMYSSVEEAYMYEEMSEESFKVGKLSVNGCVYVLKDCSDGWLYAESGDVRGFVREDILSDSPVTVERHTFDPSVYFALRVMYGEKADIRKAVKTESVTPEPSDAAVMLSPCYNSAYAYIRATVTDPVVEGSYGIALSDIDIRDRKSPSGEAVGFLKEGGLLQVLLEEGDWLYVESRDVRGFVRREDVRYGDSVDSEVEESGAGTYARAEEKMDPKDNRALYYTMKSAKAGSSSSDIRKAIVEKAASCIGNPYVWGGTSLTNGADCSGFVQSIYRCFGISLPRVACDQAERGTQIPLDQAQPGDLVFFAKNGYVYHVAMIAGYNGETIEAYSSSYGIISHSTEGRSVVWCCNYLD